MVIGKFIGIRFSEAAQPLGQRVGRLFKFVQIIQHRGGKSAGAIRVSFGIASNVADAERFVAFAAGLRDQSTLAVGAASFDIESCRVIRDGS